MVIDCAYPRALARFWRETMDWTLHEETDDHALLRSADVGQGDVPRTVLADPEGNEFCVLG